MRGVDDKGNGGSVVCELLESVLEILYDGKLTNSPPALASEKLV